MIKPQVLRICTVLGLVLLVLLGGWFVLGIQASPAGVAASLKTPQSILILQLDLLGIFFLSLFLLLIAAIPLVVYLQYIYLQQTSVCAKLPNLLQNSPADWPHLSASLRAVLLPMHALWAQKNQQLQELSEQNEIFANALDEINEVRLELRRTERRWALALNATGDGIWEWNREQDSWYFSARWKAILGYRENELPNAAATFDGFIHPDDVEGFRHKFTRFVQNGDAAGSAIFEAEIRMRHQDGRWIKVLSRAVADRDLDGQILSVVGAQSDVTEQRKAMVELSQAKDAAETAFAQLRGTQQQMIESEKLAALGALVAGVAHEVNTPLGIALTAASTLSEDTIGVLHLMETGALKKTELQHYLEVARDASQLILRHCHNAAALIRSFKNISVDQTAEMVRDFDLGLYLEEILQSLRPSLKHQSHAVTMQCPDGILVHTYPSAFTQIINNLLNNALMHAFPGRENGQISIVVRRLNESEIELRFMDNGIGIEPSARAKVFEPFYTTKRGQGGSGLGMSIVHNIVAAQLKGRISIEDTPGGGACFVLEFPRVLKGEE